MDKAAPTGVHISAIAGRSRRYLGLATLCILFFAMIPTVGADPGDGFDGQFEVVVPVTTIARGPTGSEIILLRTPTPSDLVGATCELTATAENQASVHPDNDLVVAGVMIPDVEALPGGTVTASQTVVLGTEIVVSVIMGPDGVFSAGVTVGFDCVPVGGTSTSTTTGETTTTTIGGTSLSTSTTSQATTTSVDVGGTSITTTPGNSTTTSVISGTDVTSTTLETEVLATEVLPFTGPTNPSAGLYGLAFAAAGLLLLLGARSVEVATATPSGPGRCAGCAADGVYETPHGVMCRTHTLSALQDDDKLWVPKRIDR